MAKKNPLTAGKDFKFPSELRLDIVSQNWVVIATGRAKRPESFKKEQKESGRVAKKDCPFCQIETQRIPTLIRVNGRKVHLNHDGRIPKNWTTVVIPNLYPAFLPSQSLNKKIEGGLYQTMNAVGFHEIVITKDHDKHLALLSPQKVAELIEVYQARYLDLMKKPHAHYIAIFHNHGRGAGATVYHPHSQIISTPLIDTDLKESLISAWLYYKKHHRCVYCQMLAWERKIKKRIIFENKDFVALCPFASKMAFQMIVSPKRHLSRFEEITPRQREGLAQAMKASLYKLYKALNNPDYNFYLHTAPVDKKKYPHCHWHFTILPKTSIHAGFELGAGMEISTIEPEKAAEYLRKQ